MAVEHEFSQWLADHQSVNGCNRVPDANKHGAGDMLADHEHH
jgi:hypothetical protein